MDDAMYLEANAFEHEGNTAAAQQGYRDLAAAYPKSEWSAKALLNIADLLLSQGRSDEARTELVKALHGFDKGVVHVRAAEKLGQILKAQGHLKEAAVYFDEAMMEAEGDLAAEIRYEAAETTEAKGQIYEAAAEYFKLYQLFPDNKTYADKALFRGARLLEQLGKVENALPIYEKIARSASPNAAEARARIEKLKPGKPTE